MPSLLALVETRWTYAVRAFSTSILLLLALCALAPRAQADLGDPDLTTMQTLAKPTSQGGAGWGAALGWNLANNPCPTTGLANWAGVTCNRSGRVEVIVAACSTALINQPFPASLLTQLTALTSLDLINCGVYGPLGDLSSMTQLTRLRLDANALSGQIPPGIATLPNLGYLTLDGNRFTGPVPDLPNGPSTLVALWGNFLTSIPATWTQFNRDLSYNNFSSFPSSCASPSDTNQCGPNLQVSLPTVTVTKQSGDGQWAPEGGQFLNPLVVTVTDLSNNPISGATVTFSGPGIVTANATTDSNGVASAIITAGSTAGGNTVSAAVGTTGMTTFGLTVGDTPSCSATISVTGTADTGAGTLREALADVCPGGTVDLTPIAGQTIALSLGASSYNFSGRLYIAGDVTILGNGVTISGSGNTRIFFVQGGNVTLSNLILENGLGLGGSSQYGGPAAGMGGAIFQNGGNLTLNNVTLSGNTAQGGTTDASGNVNGGGFGANSSGGDLGGSGGAGDGAGGLQDGSGDPGGFGAGGGQGTVGIAGGGASGILGGVGGFGGSMGNTLAVPINSSTSQADNYPVANGYGAAFGGGAGFGGAIFTHSGTLNLSAVTFEGNSAMGGAGAPPPAYARFSGTTGNGEGKGGSLFIYNGAVLNLDAATTFAGSVAADAGAPGIGYSDATYAANSTCPGSDTVDLCGAVTNSLPDFQLTTQVFPAGTGTISPASETVASETSVQISATPNAGYMFTGFTGALTATTSPQTLTVTSAANVTANFAPIPPATVTGVSSTAANGSYSAGAGIPILVTFNKAVDVTGTPQLALNSGGTAMYTGGSGSSTLSFMYSVAAGQNSSRLDYTSSSALTLNGGTISSDTVSANLTLPTPGAAGSLGANKSIVIDTTAPTVVSYSVDFGGKTYNLTGAARTAHLPWTITAITVVFSKPIATASTGSLSGVTATGLSGLGTTTLTWTISPVTNATIASMLAGSGPNAIKDSSGNGLSGGAGFSQSFSVLYGDFNGDGVVNPLDFTQVIAAESAAYNLFADINGDGVVNSTDATIVRSQEGHSQQ